MRAIFSSKINTKRLPAWRPPTITARAYRYERMAGESLRVGRLQPESLVLSTGYAFW